MELSESDNLINAVTKLRAVVDMLTIASPDESVKAEDLAVLLQGILDEFEGCDTKCDTKIK